ncbi:hypothetical protein [Halorussus sp. AFM4]|uniref:hypothetical protein n=1 Tax=Halorussus sp. AFM4 TaxID=3421651 RepID=UPI003EB7FA65
MRRNDIIDLLKKKPGYEIVYLLLRGPQRRQDLADHIRADGGTLERWLNAASNKGLVTISADLRMNPQTQVEEKYVEVTLNRDIPDDLISVIESRGRRGFRNSVPEFTDTGVVHHWDDPHTLETK